MADEGLTIAIRVADLTLDDEGKVIIRDPAIAQLVTVAMERAKQPAPTVVTNNCHGGNCAAGCGTK